MSVYVSKLIKGKSSLIETFGKYLTTTMNKKVAVLTVDPSSTQTGGWFKNQFKY